MLTRKFALSLVVTILVSSCAVQQKKSYFESLPPNCAYKGFHCNVQEALLASKVVLQTNPEKLSVSCELIVDRKVDEAYKFKCESEIEALTSVLSSKWKNEMLPIDNSKIVYRWDLWDCVDGVGFGFCRYYGIADIPIQWVAIPPN